VIDTHRNILWVLESGQRFEPVSDRDRAISYLPLAHAADRALNYYMSLISGHTLVFCPDLAQLFPLLLEVRPTTFGGVPRIWEKLYAGLTSAIAKEPDEQRRGMVLGALEVARTVVAMEQRGEPVPAELRQQRAQAEPMFAAIRARIGFDACATRSPAPRRHRARCSSSSTRSVFRSARSGG